MQQTANYALKKIELNDSPPDITVINPNWETIDQKLKELEVSDVTHKADYVSHTGYANATGSANAYIATLTPALSAYQEGVSLRLKINVANTGAATANVNGLGAKAIKKQNGNPVTAGNLKAGLIYTLVYDGTSFLQQGEGGEYGNVTPNDVRLGKTFGTEDGVANGTLNLTNLIPSNIKVGVVIDGKTGTLNPDVFPMSPGGNVIMESTTSTQTPSIHDNDHVVKTFTIGAMEGSARISFMYNGYAPSSVSGNDRWDPGKVRVVRNGELVNGPHYLNVGDNGRDIAISFDTPIAKGDVFQIIGNASYYYQPGESRYFVVWTKEAKLTTNRPFPSPGAARSN